MLLGFFLGFHMVISGSISGLEDNSFLASVQGFAGKVIWGILVETLELLSP